MASTRALQLTATLLLSLVISSALGHQRRHRRAGWSCPTITAPELSCQCDLAHTLRCTSSSGHDSERQVASVLTTLAAQPKERFVSLLELSIQNLTRLSPRTFDGLSLHGLVVTSGELADVSPDAFAGLGASLSALGLPNNRLTSVPALASLKRLERLDLSNNRIRSIDAGAFRGLERLRFLDLNGNGLETLGPGAFKWTPSLRTLHLGNNRLDGGQLDVAGLGKLQEMDLSGNRLRGRLTSAFLQGLDSLVTLDLSANNLTLLKRGMLAGLKRLRVLRLARNQVIYNCSPRI